MASDPRIPRQTIGSRLRAVTSARFWRSVGRGFVGYIRRERRHLSVHRMRVLFGLRLKTALRDPTALLEWPRTRVSVWVDGDELFPHLHHLIRRAKTNIVVQMFIWRDDGVGRALAAALVAAADRGVVIDVTKDAMGDGFEFSEDFVGTRLLRSAPWDRFWSHPNITVRHLAGGDHSKAFVVDGDRLLLGGMNVGEEYRRWHDYFVELRGRRWVEAYLEGRSRTSPRGSLALVLNTPDGAHDIRSHLTALISGARRTVLVEQAYLSDPAIIDLLARRSRDGIQVTVILPAAPDIHGNANLHAVDRLLATGDPRNIWVFLFPRMLHAKLLLVDRRRLFIGSANLTTSSLDTLGEANVLIRRGHRRALRRIRAAIRKDIRVSRLLTERPRLWWWSRLKARVGL